MLLRLPIRPSEVAAATASPTKEPAFAGVEPWLSRAMGLVPAVAAGAEGAAGAAGAGAGFCWRRRCSGCCRAGAGADRVVFLLGDVADVVHLGVSVLAWAGGVSYVAVGEDVGQAYCLAVGVEGVAGAFGVVGVVALGVDTCDFGAPAGEFANGFDHGLWGLDYVIVTHHGDSPGVGVEATCVCANDALVQSAVAAFEEVAVFVGEGVVSDVAPAEGLCVVFVDAAHDAGGFFLAVVVGSGGVVDDDGCGGVFVFWSGAAEGFVGTPACAGDDAGHAVGVGGEADAVFGKIGGSTVDKDCVQVGCVGAKDVNAADGYLHCGCGFDVDQVGALFVVGVV